MSIRLYVLILAIVTAGSYTVEGNVINLQDSDLNNMTRIFPKLFVFYYVPWCQHSQKLAPVFQLLANRLYDEGSPIRLAKINCEQQEEAYDFAQIMRFPLLKYYSGGDEIEFDGDRTFNYLHKWLTKRVKFPILSLDQNKLQFLRKANSTQISIVYYGSLKSANAADFISMAYHDNYNSYYYIQEQLKPEGTVQLLRSFDEDVSILPRQKQLEKWIRLHDRPLVVPLDERSISHVFKDGNKGVFLFIEPHFQRLKNVIIQTARLWKTRKNSQLELTFIQIPEEHEDYFGLMQYLGLHAVDRPLVVVDGSKQTKYILSFNATQLNPEIIIHFLINIENSKVEAKPLEEHNHVEDFWEEMIKMNQTQNQKENNQIPQRDAANYQVNEQKEANQGKKGFLKRESTFLLTREL